MIPSCFVVLQLLVDLGVAIQTQLEAAHGLISQERMLTTVSWLTYPSVYIIKIVGIDGSSATCAVQIGFSIAAAKCGAMEKEATLA